VTPATATRRRRVVGLTYHRPVWLILAVGGTVTALAVLFFLSVGYATAS
jgi:hypothetical protein